MRKFLPWKQACGWVLLCLVGTFFVAWMLCLALYWRMSDFLSERLFGQPMAEDQ